MENIIISESGMKFGEYPKKDVFLIEKSTAYKQLMSNGIKSCEFILNKNNLLLFIEAKSSCPNYNNRDDTSIKKENYNEYIDSIAQKFKNSLEIFFNIIVGRRTAKDFPSSLYKLDFSKIDIVFVVVVKDSKLEWLIPYSDKLKQVLRTEKLIWKIKDIIFITEKTATHKKIVIPAENT